MTVWVFDNEDASGVFSSKEKALASLRAGADRCGWKILEVNDCEEYILISYAYQVRQNSWQIGRCTICSYLLDEDNFG